MSEGITLLDRLTRNQGLMSLLQVLDREDSQNFLVALSKAIHEASHPGARLTRSTSTGDDP